MRKRPQSAQPSLSGARRGDGLEIASKMSSKGYDLRKRHSRGEETTTEDLRRFEQLEREALRLTGAAGVATSQQQSTSGQTAGSSSFVNAMDAVSTPQKQPGASLDMDAIEPADTDPAFFATVNFGKSKPKWLPEPLVGSFPMESDPELTTLVSHQLDRRQLRQSYPTEAEAPDRQQYEQQHAAEQVHRLAYAFRASDVLAPDEIALLDCKAEVRQLVSMFEDRSTFKHHAEVELEAWVKTLPSRAREVEALASERTMGIEHDQLEQQSALTSIETGQEQLETGARNLMAFSTHMFDTLSDLERRRHEKDAQEAKKRSRATKHASTTTVFVVPMPMSAPSLLSPADPQSSSNGGSFANASVSSSATSAMGTERGQPPTLPYGCKPLPHELFTLPDATSSASASSRAASPSPVRPGAARGVVSPRSPRPLSVSALSASSPQGGSRFDPSAAEAAHIMYTTAMQSNAAITEDLERSRAMCESVLRQKEAHELFWGERLDSMMQEVERLRTAVANNRSDVQQVLESCCGVEIPWEDVGNGRTAAEFLRDNFSTFSEAIIGNARKETESRVVAKARSDAQSDADELRVQIQQLHRQMNEAHRIQQSDRKSMELHEQVLKGDIERLEREAAVLSSRLETAQSDLIKAQNREASLQVKYVDALRKLEDVQEAIPMAQNRVVAVSRQCDEKVLAAQRVAESIGRRIRGEVEAEVARLRTEAERAGNERDVAHQLLEQNRTSSQQRIANLERVLNEYREGSMDRRSFWMFYESFTGAINMVLLAMKQVRISVTKDNGLLLRSGCMSACMEMCKALQRCFRGQSLDPLMKRFLVDACLETSQRVERQVSWEMEECQRAEESIRGSVEPSDAVIAALKKEISSLREEVGAAATAQEVAFGDLQTFKQLSTANDEAVMELLTRHFKPAVLQICEAAASWVMRPPEQISDGIPHGNWNANKWTLSLISAGEKSSDTRNPRRGSVATTAKPSAVLISVVPPLLTEIVHAVRNSIVSALTKSSQPPEALEAITIPSGGLWSTSKATLTRMETLLELDNDTELNMHSQEEAGVTGLPLPGLSIKRFQELAVLMKTVIRPLELKYLARTSLTPTSTPRNSVAREKMQRIRTFSLNCAQLRREFHVASWRLLRLLFLRDLFRRRLMQLKRSWSVRASALEARIFDEKHPNKDNGLRKGTNATQLFAPLRSRLERAVAGLERSCLDHMGMAVARLDSQIHTCFDVLNEHQLEFAEAVAETVGSSTEPSSGDRESEALRRAEELQQQSEDLQLEVAALRQALASVGERTRTPIPSEHMLGEDTPAVDDVKRSRRRSSVSRRRSPSLTPSQTPRSTPTATEIIPPLIMPPPPQTSTGCQTEPPSIEPVSSEQHNDLPPPMADVLARTMAPSDFQDVVFHSKGVDVSSQTTPRTLHDTQSSAVWPLCLDVSSQCGDVGLSETLPPPTQQCERAEIAMQTDGITSDRPDELEEAHQDIIRDELSPSGALTHTQEVCVVSTSESASHCQVRPGSAAAGSKFARTKGLSSSSSHAALRVVGSPSQMTSVAGSGLRFAALRTRSHDAECQTDSSLLAAYLSWLVAPLPSTSLSSLPPPSLAISSGPPIKILAGVRTAVSAVVPYFGATLPSAASRPSTATAKLGPSKLGSGSGPHHGR